MIFFFGSLFCRVPNLSKTYPGNELPVLSGDCRFLVLLAKIQTRVDKNEDALLSLQRVSVSASVPLQDSIYRIFHRINSNPLCLNR